MKITKLTITPLSKGWYGTVIELPAPERAGRLIKERLNCGYTNQDKPAGIFRKIPAFLKGFVNPECKKPDERKFTTTG